MFKNPEYNSIAVVLLVGVAAVTGWFIVGKNNAGSTGLVLSQVQQAPNLQPQLSSGPTALNTATSSIWIYGTDGDASNVPVFKSTNPQATAWAFVGNEPFPTEGVLTAGIFFANELRDFGFQGYPNNTFLSHSLSSGDGINWTTHANPPWFPRLYYQVAQSNSTAYVLGGNSQSQNNNNLLMNDVWASTDGVNWIRKTQAASWQPRIAAATVFFNNKLWIMGGFTGPNEGAPMNDVWSSVDGGITWVEATASAQWSKRGLATALSFNGKMYIIGGWQGGCGVVDQHCINFPTLSDVWSSSDGINWTLVTDHAAWGNYNNTQFGRAAHCSVVFDKQMWVIGGQGRLTQQNINADYKDIWSSSDGSNWTKQGDLSSFIQSTTQPFYSSICAVNSGYVPVVPQVTNPIPIINNNVNINNNVQQLN